MEAKVYEQEHATIYGHNVWHYLIDTPIGQIHVVDYEAQREIKRIIIDADNQKAEKTFKRICHQMTDGKFL